MLSKAREKIQFWKKFDDSYEYIKSLFFQWIWKLLRFHMTYHYYVIWTSVENIGMFFVNASKYFFLRLLNFNPGINLVDYL